MKAYDSETLVELDPFTYYQTCKLDDVFASSCCKTADLSEGGLSYPPAADEDDYLWVTHKGVPIYVSAMQTDHLFNTFRMLFNHGVSPAFRVGDFIRHNDIFEWDRDYKEEAFEALQKEVIKRKDELDQEQKDELEDIKSNGKAFEIILAQENPADPLVGEPYDVD